MIHKKSLQAVSYKLVEWSTYSIALFPLIPGIWNSISIILWTLSAVICRVKYTEKPSPDKEPLDKGWFLLYAGNFLLLFISLSYSVDVQEGVSKLITQLPMLLFPIVFFLLPFPLSIDNIFLPRILNVFLCSTVLISLWVLYNYWDLGLMGHLDAASSFNTILRETAADLTDKHPTILSFYLSFSIVIGITNVLKESSGSLKVLNCICIAVLFFLLLLLASRTPILATLIALVLFFIRQVRRPVFRLGISVLLVAFFFLLVRFTPAIYSRVQETFRTDLSTPEGANFNSTNIRVGIFICTWQLIKEKPLLGHGAGSHKKVLSECYTQFPTEAYKSGFYNTHNQYANFWLLSGIPGILLFIFSILYAFIQAFKHRREIFIYFLVLFSIGFLTDDLLTRQSGVVIYYFFLCLFLMNLRLSNKGLAEIRSGRNNHSINSFNS